MNIIKNNLNKSKELKKSNISLKIVNPNFNFLQLKDKKEENLILKFNKLNKPLSVVGNT